MRIKKTSQYMQGGASLSNTYGTSNENGYTQQYINNLHTYSETEHRVGTWVDGKPIYATTIKYTSFTTGEQAKNHGIANISYIIDAKAVGKRDGVSNPDFEVVPAIVPPNYNSQYQLSIYDINKTRFQLYLGSQLQTTNTKLLELYVTIYYTKTTD